MSHTVVSFFLLLLGTIPTQLAAEPFLAKIDLFAANEEGFKQYRIPGIVVTKRGTVLAYCEARKADSGDWGPIDVILRRSKDGGQTWTPPQQLVHLEGQFPINPLAVAQNLDKPGDTTVNNPVAIVDYDTGAVHVLYCLEYMSCFYMRSDDDGETWSDAIDVTPAFEAFRNEYDWKVIATGPAHGIQLAGGEFAGRLILPVWLSLGTGGHAHRPSVAATIFSDDHGKSWRRGEIAVPDTSEFIWPNETAIVQLVDGRVLLNSRSESHHHRRIVTLSADGATQWSMPKFDNALLEPICMAALVRVRPHTKEHPGSIVFSNPDNLSRRDGKDTPGLQRDRINLTIKSSKDECCTWSGSRQLEMGVSGYSDLASLSDGTILCFYERGVGNKPGSLRTGLLTLARFNEEWIKEGLPQNVP